MKRPHLNKIGTELTSISGIMLTMSEGQWDGLLEAAYDDGATLMELDKDENLIAVYRKPETTN